ncbi:MAG TPA: ABC transporter permease subunit, partial [bacterium]
MPWLIFAALFVGYALVAHVRHKENPQDKLVPTISQMVDGFKRAAFEPDKRTNEYRLLVDTAASTKRFLVSLFILSLVGVLLGLHMGSMPYFERLFYRFVLFFDKTPALALLPILFIIFGLGEVSKIALIVIGVTPTIVLDTYLRARSVPREQVVKALTLGASDFEVVYKVVLPRIFPKVLDTIRLNFKAIVLFLIAGEALAAVAGLGYRIFLVRRYVA